MEGGCGTTVRGCVVATSRGQDGSPKPLVARHYARGHCHSRAIRLDPHNAGAYLNRSVTQSELGRHDEAIADLDEAIHLDPDRTFATGDW